MLVSDMRVSRVLISVVVSLVCSVSARSQAKDNVLIFTIAFEMGDQSSAAGKLRSCASEVGYHYDANTVNIKQAFGSIAANVQKLRLTQ